ncbi:MULTISPECIES: response regulator transcription factor [unclassified Beijerinckia]|uniref:LuxR C-terminal-related transcriptional regulator n=1 Tax=unclassified Beijerinckia TaxID=2638183 RepID=UPI0008948D48|nr:MULTISPECIES: response regulator transcription factor [unclassified Beijerinckia]MDH7796995.1 two-component system nitrate/nitrite response regulator NarL [Beijerinckia sp. GAS462]SEC67913.1 two component transcriptional regulator, LuxR family [Beijerinckia sp. 28-YEA-48]
MSTSFATVVTGSHALAREGLCRMLISARFEIAGTVTNVLEIIPKIEQKQRPVLVVVIGGDEFSTTLEQIETCRRLFSNDRIVVLACGWRISDVGAAFAAGANACLDEDTNARALIKSLELVMLGMTLFPQNVVAAVFSRDVIPDARSAVHDAMGKTHASGVDVLSDRETRILESLKTGDSNKVLARKLGISEATVKVHVKAILRKIHVQNRTQAAFWALSKGLESRAPQSIAQAVIAE